jgi:phage I-like protein
VEPSDAVHEVSAVGEDLEQLRCRLGLGDDTTAVGVMKAADAEIERLQKAAASRAADDRVAEAVRAGKLAPAQHEWAHQLALKNPTDFDAWLADAPTVVVMGRLTDSASVSAGSPRRQIVASARAEYRANEMLSSLTTESAWIANALRERGFDMIKEDGAGH